MSEERAPRVSVVIPVLNGARVIGACLDAIARQERAPAIEVIVVDNGSTDDTGAIVAAHPLGARLLRERARGSYSARNAGIAAARGEVLAFTDADCLPEAGWIAAGLTAIENGADLVGGAVVQLGSDRPTIWERYDRATYLRQDEFIVHDRFAATANLFVRASVFADVGPFASAMTAGGDLEFGRRATGAGHRLVYGGDARVGHRPRRTLRETWALHRRLGSGFAHLARLGIRGRPWTDLGLRISLGEVVEKVAADGPRIRRRRLAPVHAVAMLARWTGRLTGRG